jgi:hypothetical protein
MELEYKIKTSAELAGAESAADALERQIGKAKALKQDYSALEAQLKTMRASIEEYKDVTKSETDAADELKRANDQLADSVHTVSRSEAELAEHAEHATISHRGLHKIAGELNHVLPGLGEVMMVAFNPVVALLVILVGLFASLKEHIQAASEEMAKMAEANINVTKITDGTQAMEAQMETLDAAVGKADEFAVATNHIADAQKKVADNTNEAITALQTQAKYEDEEAKARQKIALDQVKLQLAAGQISEAQAEAMKSEIEGDFSREADKRKSKLETDEIAARKKEQEELTAQQIELANKKISEAGKPATAQSTAEDAKNLAAKYKKDADDQQKYLRDFGKDMSSDEYSRQFAKLMQLGQLQGQQEGVADDMAEKAKAAKTEWEKTVTALKKVNDRLAELDEQIPVLESKHTAADEHRKIMRGFSDESDATGRVASDEKRVNDDIKILTEISGKKTQTAEDGVRARKALFDMQDALNDAAATIKELAGMGVEVAKIKQQLYELRTMALQAKAAADTH